MQNSGLILSNEPSQKVNHETTSSTRKDWHRSLVIGFWLSTVTAVVLYATWTVL